ncbi:MAG: 16S rRNA (guanine(966)-N(2))-methyltransferase RsmD [Erysipelotrichia bacterium]|nr:16S rRNA (guanine(966)-N(2))-methyltransferase RsmD [Erysipelotrichia bacterium]NCC54887.1 16S rRNA (guanine(966)-N(2))-methyltransferase RsmD [Erysipelotrichia bacterium]
MRIIAGKHRSRKLKTLDGMNTRPTQDKIKEAIFSSAGTYFNGGNMLDLFAGSGSVGLESLSRGIDKVYLCDQSKEAMQVIQSNIALLKEESACELYLGSYEQALKQWQQCSFAFIFIDPPYALKVIEQCLISIDEHNMLDDYGLLVVETSKEDCFLQRYGKLIKKKEKCYGITRITYFVKELEV